MRRSLSGRLLALSVIVALSTAAATAWLTTYVTSRQLRSEFEAMTNVHRPVMEELSVYTRSHSSWDDVDTTIESLADTYGYRIVLTTEDGYLVADSQRQSAVSESLPETHLGTFALDPPDIDLENPERSTPASGWVDVYIGTGNSLDLFAGDGWRRLVVTVLIGVAGVTSVAFIAGRILTRPLRELTEAVRKTQAGERGVLVSTSAYDEVARLGSAFNDMLAAIETGEKTRQAMVNDVAHELRTPLTNIHGYLEATEDGVVDIDPALIGTLQAETDQLLSLVDDLHDLALADAGTLQMHPEECDVAELAEQVVTAARQRAQDAGVTLSVYVPEHVVLFADPVRLRQALGNLVDNAVRVTPENGFVSIHVHTQQDDVLISVVDTGPGIAAEHIPLVFDRFFRTDASRGRASGGSGLGLAISRQIVTAMGGSIDVTSEVGRGATFMIRLPRVEALARL